MDVNVFDRQKNKIKNQQSPPPSSPTWKLWPGGKMFHWFTFPFIFLFPSDKTAKNVRDKKPLDDHEDGSAASPGQPCTWVHTGGPVRIACKKAFTGDVAEIQQGLGLRWEVAICRAYTYFLLIHSGVEVVLGAWRCFVHVANISPDSGMPRCCMVRLTEEFDYLFFSFFQRNITSVSECGTGFKGWPKSKLRRATMVHCHCY